MKRCAFATICLYLLTSVFAGPILKTQDERQKDAEYMAIQGIGRIATLGKFAISDQKFAPGVIPVILANVLNELSTVANAYQATRNGAGNKAAIEWASKSDDDMFKGLNVRREY